MTNEEHIDLSEYTFYKDKHIWSKHWEKFLEGYVRPNGYVVVSLKCTDGKYRSFLYHRVIWFAFNGPIPEGYEINHLDENKQNNRLSNLSLTSHVENCNYGTRNERQAAKLRGVPKSEEWKAKMRGRKLSEEHKRKIGAKLKGSLNPMFGKHHSEETKAKLRNHPNESKQVVAVDIDDNVVYEFPSTMEAGRNGFNQGAVAACCRNCYGKLGNIYKNLRWYYKEEYEKLMWEEVMIGET